MPPSKVARTAADYWALPKGARAELIDGELRDLAAPTWRHQELVLELAMRLKLYVAEHGGPCRVCVAPLAVDLFADETTIVEPDVLVVCDRGKLSDRGCAGAPDFVAEIVSPSNPGMDYLSKLGLYRSAGVREYWICDPQEERTLVYDFEEELPPSVCPFAAPVTSRLFPGFEIDFSAVIAGM